MSVPALSEISKAQIDIFAALKALARPNLAPNPRFASWPSGTGPIGDDGETAAGWYLVNGTGSTNAISQAAGMVDAANCLQWGRSVEGTVATYIGITLPDVARLSGRTITVSGVVKGETSGLGLTLLWVQSFGTGGSSAVAGSEVALPVSTTAARFEVTLALPSTVGKTIPATQAADGTVIRFQRNVGAGLGNVWLEDIKVEEGLFGTAFAAPTPEQRASEAGVPAAKNLIENPTLSLWQEKTSYVQAAAGTVRVADRWKTQRAVGGYTVSQQAGFAGAESCLRAQRDAGNTSAAVVFVGQQVESSVTREMAGRWAVLSFDVRAGADYSAANKTLNVYASTGTGSDEVYTPTSGAAFPTGNATQVLTLSAVSNRINANRSKRAVSAAFFIPSTATELAVTIAFPFTGTAGANDYAEITNAKLELASQYGRSTAFEPPNPAEVLRQCRRHYQTSVAIGTTPAQNLGLGTGEFRAPALAGGAGTNRPGTIVLSEPMRAVPSITLLNPAAANGQVRDATLGADCSASTAGNVGRRSFELTCAGAMMTASGNTLAVHWIADARL